MYYIIISHILILLFHLFLRKSLVMLTHALFIFLLQKDFHICLGLFFAFLIFLLQKDFDIIHVLLFEAFLCFWYSYISFLYIEKNMSYVIYMNYVNYLSYVNYVSYVSYMSYVCRLYEFFELCKLWVFLWIA